MIVYNVTVKVSWHIWENWVVWMKEEHIPAVLATGCFDDAKFYRLLEQEEEEGPTFVAQYATSSSLRYERYVMEFAPILQEAGRSRWGNQYIAFRTIMQLLS